jgi:hypothetical protein
MLKTALQNLQLSGERKQRVDKNDCGTGRSEHFFGDLIEHFTSPIDYVQRAV